MDVESSNELVGYLARMARGDRTAFSRLYDETAPRLYALAMRICRAQALAEDVLQDSFVRIWRKADQFQPELGHPLAWMTTIVRRQAIDAIRHRGREVHLEGEKLHAQIERTDDLFQRLRRTDDARAIRACLDALEPAQRACILVAYYEGCAHPEVAERLGLPLGTAKSHIRRGLQRLKRCLET